MGIQVEYEAGEHYSEEFVTLVAKAANQLGIDYELTFRNREVQSDISDGNNDPIPIKSYRFPVVRFPEEHQENVERRAMFLHGRNGKHLPTDPLPDGSWPDSDEEYAEPILVNVAPDGEKGSVVLDLGRSLRAVAMHPSAARSLAMWLMATANQMGGEVIDDDLVQTRVAFVRECEGGSEKQASLAFRDFFVSTSPDDETE